MPRACVIVLDAVGAGELPDAAEYGDEGSDTLGNVARAVRGPPDGAIAGIVG
jgi:phosphopentomutase